KSWTFGGTVPGPVVRVREGDLVRIRLVNEASMPHSIDFHAARIPMNKAFRTILPKDSLSFEFIARDPGAYLVHCGTPPVLLHLMQGMYLPIIVDPKGGWPGKVDKEFVIVQSEFYVQDGDPAHALSSVQTYGIPAGGGAVFETLFDKDASGEGVYAFVTHAFADAAKGAVGLIRVGAPQVAAMAH